MYIMRHTQIKGGKQPGKEADKETGQQNIHVKRRVLRLGNTALGKTTTEEGFGGGQLSNIEIEKKWIKNMEKTSLGALDLGQCQSKLLDKHYTWTAETLLLLVLIVLKYNNPFRNATIFT